MVWQMGLIAAAASLAMAWAIVYFYEKGAGSIDRKSAYIIMTIIIGGGVILQILAGMTADLAVAAMENNEDVRNAGILRLLLNGGFWQYATENIVGNFEFVSAYGSTILWTVVFALARSYSTVAQLFVDTRSQAGKSK